jgi:hypothetical protein
MPLYKIRRRVGEMSQDEMDAAAFRAIVCAPQFPGLKWHRSFWDREAGLVDCLYEAEDQAQIEEHARVSRIPCDEVRPVDELIPDAYINS